MGSAEIGLNDRLPQSLTQISSRARTRGPLVRSASALDSASARSDFDPSGSPRLNRLPSMCLITPGSGTSAARTTQPSTRSGPNPSHCAFGINGGETRTLKIAADLVEVPPWHVAAHDGRVWTDEWCHFGNHGRHRMRLECDDHIVLWPQILGVVKAVLRWSRRFL